MSQVIVQNVFKSFGKQEVLKNVSIEIAEGEIFGLIGPNGAGKSTLIDILTGLQKADSGHITVAGLNVPKDITNVREKLGLVPQEIALLPEQNAKDNLIYFASLYGMSGNQLKEAVGEALEVVGLTDTDKKAIKTFSGGMKRRLNIAAAIMHKPKLLILDEPTVGVDPQSRNLIFDFIKKLNKENGTTVLYTSHYMEEVESLCDRILILDTGSEVAYGTQDEIKMLVQDKTKWQLDIIAPNDTLQDQLLKIKGVDNVLVDDLTYQIIVNPLYFKSKDLLALLHDERIQVDQLVRQELSLEEAFLQLTGKSLRD